MAVCARLLWRFYGINLILPIKSSRQRDLMRSRVIRELKRIARITFSAQNARIMIVDSENRLTSSSERSSGPSVSAALEIVVEKNVVASSSCRGGDVVSKPQLASKRQLKREKFRWSWKNLRQSRASSCRSMLTIFSIFFTWIQILSSHRRECDW